MLQAELKKGVFQEHFQFSNIFPQKVTPMNDMQKLIFLRGLTIGNIAEEIGHGYHMVQKVIKGTKYKRRDGSLGTYANEDVRQAVATRLGLTCDEAWGTRSRLVLRRLIRQEIKHRARQQEQDLQQQWLNDDRIPEKQVVANV